MKRNVVISLVCSIVFGVFGVLLKLNAWKQTGDIILLLSIISFVIMVICLVLLFFRKHKVVR